MIREARETLALQAEADRILGAVDIMPVVKVI